MGRHYPSQNKVCVVTDISPPGFSLINTNYKNLRFWLLAKIPCNFYFILIFQVRCMGSWLWSNTHYASKRIPPKQYTKHHHFARSMVMEVACHLFLSFFLLNSFLNLSPSFRKLVCVCVCTMWAFTHNANSCGTSFNSPPIHIPTRLHIMNG